jgi:hypothetical protein
MFGENRQFVTTNEPVEFEKQLVEVEDCKKMTYHSREIYRRIYPNSIKKNWRLSTCTGWTCKH